MAERRRIEAHPSTGAIQIVEVRERVEEVAPTVQSAPTKAPSETVGGGCLLPSVARRYCPPGFRPIGSEKVGSERWPAKPALVGSSGHADGAMQGNDRYPGSSRARYRTRYGLLSRILPLGKERLYLTSEAEAPTLRFDSRCRSRLTTANQRLLRAPQPSYPGRQKAAGTISAMVEQTSDIATTDSVVGPLSAVPSRRHRGATLDRLIALYRRRLG